MTIFTWMLTALSMIGVVLNAQAVLFGFYFVACLYGAWVWKKAEAV